LLNIQRGKKLLSLQTEIHSNFYKTKNFFFDWIEFASMHWQTRSFSLSWHSDRSSFLTFLGWSRDSFTFESAKYEDDLFESSVLRAELKLNENKNDFLSTILRRSRTYLKYVKSHTVFFYVYISLKHYNNVFNLFYCKDQQI